MSRRLAKCWWWTVDWARFLGGRETRDQAWIEGSNYAEEGMQEMLDGKEGWIDELEHAIDEMLKVLTDEQWRKLPTEVQDHLRNHL